MSTFLAIIAFIIGLSLLILIHEFGHFLACRIFNVYVYEFSIGFGKKILRKKMHNGETYFEIGILPFGGYVAMYGDDEDEVAEKNKEESLNSDVKDDKKPTDPNDIENLNIPLSRSLEGIAKPKKAIIVSAGIIFNFILGYILYLIAMSCFPYNAYLMTVETADTKATPTAFNIQLDAIKTNIDVDNEYLAFSSTYVYDQNDLKTVGSAVSTQVYINDDITTTYALFPGGDMKVNDLSIDSTLYRSISSGSGSKVYQYYLYKTWKEDRVVKDSDGNDVTKNISIFDSKTSYYSQSDYVEIKKINVTFSLIKGKLVKNSDNKVVSVDNKNITEAGKLTGDLTMGSDGLLSKTNLNAMHDYQRYLGWESFGKAGQKWANATGAIFSAVGKLFIGQGWDQTGGIIMMFAQSSVIFETYPFSYYIELWALISVNLGIMNLLPFPGLDGWHLLVTIIESITRKKLNPKFKKYASAIGLILLLVLGVALVVVDIVRLATGTAIL